MSMLSYAMYSFVDVLSILYDTVCSEFQFVVANVSYVANVRKAECKELREKG